MSPTLIYFAAAVLVAIGLVGIVLPALPGLPLVFCGMLLGAWADGFTHVGVATLSVLALLTLLSLAVDFWAAAMGAKRVGASRLALVGALVGTLAGVFFGPVGLFLGPFVGALAGELLHGRRLDGARLGQATRVGIGTWMGMVAGIALKLMLAGAMLGLFAWSWWY
ncbi:MAG TPA: DUF456 domain-containing protein [Luteimonas sp.]|jgi:uncharacterized protein YqgC (DUF456 family)|nr:DUF456 domain-containing protein [Luteimonas sp.]